MNRLRNLNLLLIGLAGFFAWLLWSLQQPTEVLEAPSIQRLAIEKSGGQMLEFEKTHTGWRLLGEEDSRLDQQRMRQLVARLVKPAHANYPGAKPLAQYGLQPPRLRVWLDGQPLLIGHAEPLQGLLYAHDGERLQLLSNRLAPWLSQAPESLIAEPQAEPTRP